MALSLQSSVLVDDEFVRLGRVVRHAAIRGGPAAARRARDLLGSCEAALSPSLRAAAELLVTELVTNAVRHGGARGGQEVQLVIERSQRALWVAVTDPGAGFEWQRRPVERRPDDGGYGLVLVDRLARRWGIECGSLSTTVWFELPPD